MFYSRWEYCLSPHIKGANRQSLELYMTLLYNVIYLLITKTFKGGQDGNFCDGFDLLLNDSFPYQIQIWVLPHSPLSLHVTYWISSHQLSTCSDYLVRFGPVDFGSQQSLMQSWKSSTLSFLIFFLLEINSTKTMFNAWTVPSAWWAKKTVFKSRNEGGQQDLNLELASEHWLTQKTFVSRSFHVCSQNIIKQGYPKLNFLWN